VAEPIKPAVEMIQQQLKELEAILKQAEKDMNTMAGSERVAKWKAGTLPLIAQQLGRKEAQRFADTRPGPSFTNDLLEELSDEIEVYRNFLVTLAERVKRPG
jgi:hypothetical protein